MVIVVMVIVVMVIVVMVIVVMVMVMVIVMMIVIVMIVLRAMIDEPIQCGWIMKGKEELHKFLEGFVVTLELKIVHFDVTSPTCAYVSVGWIRHRILVR